MSHLQQILKTLDRAELDIYSGKPDELNAKLNIVRNTLLALPVRLTLETSSQPDVDETLYEIAAEVSGDYAKLVDARAKAMNLLAARLNPPG